MKNRALAVILSLLLSLNIFPMFGIAYAQDKVESEVLSSDQEQLYMKMFCESIATPKVGRTSMILMHSNGLTWGSLVRVKDLCENWDEIDIIVPVDTYQISIGRNNSGDLEFKAPCDTYKTGDTAFIIIYNETKDVTIEVAVNFTCKESIPTFTSWEQALHWVDNIERRSFSSNDVYVDSSLQPKVTLTEETITTFNSIAQERLEAYKDFEKEETAVIGDCGKVDNSDSFFALVRNKGNWEVSISISEINNSWNIDDQIVVDTIFDTDRTNDEIHFYCDSALLSEGETIIVLIENVTKNESKEVFLNCSDGKTFRFETEEKAHLFGIWDTDQYSVVNLKETQSYPKSTTPSTKYRIYTANNTLYNNTIYNNPFVAIKYVTDNALEGYTVKQTNDSTVVFKLQQNVRTTFYKFQFTQYYGSTNATGAQQWYNGYGYIHLVRSDGIFGYNTQLTNSQPYAHSHQYYGNTPASYLLEGTTGGYVSVHALSYSGYRVMKGTVGLSNAQVYKGGMNVNPYAFMTSVTSNAFCDLGLIYIDSGAYTTGWYLCKNSSTNGFSLGTVTLVTPASNPKNVEFTYTYATGSVSLAAKNVYTGVTSYISDYASVYDSTQTYVGLAAITSLVPVVGSTSNGLHIVADIKSDAYFKNVVWSSIRVSATANGTYTYITPTSTQLNTIVVYDTDSTSFSYSGYNCTVDIWYDSTYQ